MLQRLAFAASIRMAACGCRAQPAESANMCGPERETIAGAYE